MKMIERVYRFKFLKRKTDSFGTLHLYFRDNTNGKTIVEVFLEGDWPESWIEYATNKEMSEYKKITIGVA